MPLPTTIQVEYDLDRRSVRKKAVMLMTELAMMDPGPAGSSVLARSLRAVARFFGFGHPPIAELTRSRPVTPTAGPRGQDPERPIHIVAAREDTIAQTVSVFRWRRHAQLLDRPMCHLPEEERKARHHAVQGLYAARDGALEIAEHHFTLAVAYPGIDLCEIPGFWQLSRSAMMTAVHAYDEVGRLREASALNARIRTQYRPRVLPPAPPNVMEIPSRSLSLTSNS